MVDKLSPEFKHALTLRLRMPISDDLNPRNFITKISAYAHVVRKYEEGGWPYRYDTSNGPQIHYADRRPQQCDRAA